MKFFLPTVAAVALFAFGCASQKPEPAPVFKPVPGPSTTTGTDMIPLDRPTPKPATNVAAAKPLPPATPPKVLKPSKPIKDTPAPPPSKAIVTPDFTLKGRVATYNEAGRFVVVIFPLGQMAKTGDRLSIYRDNLKVGEIKITGPQRDQNTVADVITGEVKAGDEVRDE